MTQKRYAVVCERCGVIDAEISDDKLYKKAPAYRRAGYHHGSRGPMHECEVVVEKETKEYRCPVCHKTCVGEEERDKHAEKEPGVQASMFVRV